MEVRMPVLEIKDLSTTFGLDITVPNGGLVASAANQRAYKSECKKIYDDFLLTMSNYFHEETIVKKQLQKLKTQVKAFHLENVAMNGRVFSSAGLRKGGFVTQMSRPKTVQGLITSSPEFYRQGKGVHSIKSAQSLCSDTSYDGVMDQRAEYSSDRRVKMKQEVFLKLGSNPMDVKFQNKQGKFIMKPISSKKKIKSAPPVEVSTPAQSQYREKMALVRSRTNFKSPTLSSDLKINNIVAIQRSLHGLPSKRMTVREVMGKAIDRKARMFRVQMDEESGTERNRRINMMVMKKPTDDVKSDSFYDEYDESYSSSGNGGVRRVEIRDNSVYSLGTTDAPDAYMEAGARKCNSGPATSRSAVEMAIVRLGFHDLPYTVPTAVNTRVSPSRMFMDANRLKGRTFLAMDKNTGVANVSPRMTRAPLTVSADVMAPSRSKIHNHRDSVAFIKQAQEEDMKREKKLNCWRQRMTFVSLKQGSLAHVLSGSGRTGAS